MEDMLQLVDELDNIIGYGPKLEVHRKKLRHRAFSLFIYDPVRDLVLLHRRALGKYHSGGLWTNACCSHPRKCEHLPTAVCRRTFQELGLTVTEDQIRELGSFEYFKDFGDLAEFEIDHVFVWKANMESLQPRLDPEEIMELQWISIRKLQQWMAESPEAFTAWFFPACDLFLKETAAR